MRRSGYVALLRGVNVGGHNKLSMQELKRVFAGAGCDNVETYIQSGNVVFEANAKTAAELPHAIASAIERSVGIIAPVIVRSAAQMRWIVDNNPYSGVAESDQLYVMSLADLPIANAVAALDQMRGHPDEFEVRGAEVYLRLIGGAGRTKLTNAWFDRALKTISTARNWRTVTKLEELVRAR